MKLFKLSPKKRSVSKKYSKSLSEESTSVFAVQTEDARDAPHSHDRHMDSLHWDERSAGNSNEKNLDHHHHHHHHHDDRFDLKNVLSCDHSCCMNQCTCESGLGGECPHHKPIKNLIYQLPEDHQSRRTIDTKHDIYISFPRYFIYKNKTQFSKRIPASLVLTKLDSSEYVCRAVGEDDSLDVVLLSGNDTIETVVKRIFTMINLHYVRDFTRSFECRVRGRIYSLSLDTGFVSVMQLENGNTDGNIQLYPGIESLDNFVTNVLIKPPPEFSRNDPFNPTEEEKRRIPRCDWHHDDVDDVFRRFVRR